jgi:hypothetical protein
MTTKASWAQAGKFDVSFDKWTTAQISFLGGVQKCKGHEALDKWLLVSEIYIPLIGLIVIWWPLTLTIFSLERQKDAFGCSLSLHPREQKTIRPNLAPSYYK